MSTAGVLNFSQHKSALFTVCQYPLDHHSFFKPFFSSDVRRSICIPSFVDIIIRMYECVCVFECARNASSANSVSATYTCMCVGCWSFVFIVVQRNSIRVLSCIILAQYTFILHITTTTHTVQKSST